MPKRLPARIVMPAAEPLSPKERQLSALRARIKGSDAYLTAMAELAYGAGWAERACITQVR